MAVAYTRIASYPDMRKNVVDVTLDASYSGGGYVLSAAQLGMLTVDNIDMTWATGEGFNPTYTTATAKMKIFKSAAGATAFTEVVNSDLTTSMKVRCDVTGTPVL